MNCQCCDSILYQHGTSLICSNVLCETNGNVRPDWNVKIAELEQRIVELERLIKYFYEK